jgi:hypothetical protein
MKGEMIMNNEFGRMWKEALVYFEVPAQHSPEGAENVTKILNQVRRCSVRDSNLGVLSRRSGSFVLNPLSPSLFQRSVYSFCL